MVFDDVEDAVSALAGREPGTAAQPAPVGEGPVGEGRPGSV
jgi:hypothetical protein